MLGGIAAVSGTVVQLTPASSTAEPATAAVTARAVHADGGGITIADVGSPVAAAPVRLRVPSIGVDSALLELGLDDDGVLVPPAEFAQAGWYTGSPAPGDIGPSVIAGHVDSRSGPAVFFRLGELAAGDDVLVERADGTTARFTVSGTARYRKDEFPTEEVYGPTPGAVLRLITCGGVFDPDRRSYRDNVVVTARLR